MRKPAVDYRKLRLHNLNTPQYRHLWLLLSWVGYFVLYFLTENLIPPERCTPVHCALDDRIPFCELFVIPYTGWYLLIIGSLLYFLLYDIPSFRSMQTYIIVTQVLAMAVYILFPNRQDLRPEQFPRENVLTAIMGFIYRIDTSTGVCPSLHVAYTLGILSTWLRHREGSRLWKGVLTVWSALICMSVAFVKQHSALDILAALPVCLAAEWFTFYRKSTKA